jgi:hypothetical protein
MSDHQDPEVAKLAEEICQSSDKKSPFAFFSEPGEPLQRFAYLRRRKFEFGTIEFDREELPDARAALISAIRRRDRIVSDWGSAQQMSPALRAIYSKPKQTAISMGLELPRALQRAFVARIAEGNQRASDETDLIP